MHLSDVSADWWLSGAPQLSFYPSCKSPKGIDVAICLLRLSGDPTGWGSRAWRFRVWGLGAPAARAVAAVCLLLMRGQRRRSFILHGAEQAATHAQKAKLNS